MSEAGEVQQPQSELEKELPQDKVRVAVDELARLFEERFENSVVKKRGEPKIVGYKKDEHALYLDGGIEYKDPRILAYQPPREFSEFRDATWWTVDQSVENQIKITRGQPNDIYEKFILNTGDTPSMEYVEYEEVRAPYNPKTLVSFEEKPRFKGKNTQKTVDKGRGIISDIPQFIKGNKPLW